MAAIGKLSRIIGLASLLLLMAVAGGIRMFPEPSLDELFEITPIIILGSTTRITTVAGGFKDAEVKVLEVLKGELSEKVVVLPAGTEGSNLGTLRFQIGGRQLMFLADVGEGAKFRYGLREFRTVNDSSLESYRKSLNSWTALKVKGTPAHEERMAWLVEQFRDEHLRGDAAIAFTRPKEPKPGAFPPILLRADQMQVISNVVFSVERITERDLEVLWLFAEADRGAVVVFLLKQLEGFNRDLKAGKAEKLKLHATVIHATMQSLTSLLGDIEVENIRTDYEKYKERDKHVEAFLTAAIEVAVKRGYLRR